MDEQHGLIETEIRLVKRDDEQIERIMKARKFHKSDRGFVEKALRMNVWTMKQFIDITGFQQSTISNKTRPSYRDGKLVTELDFCYPFADMDGPGPKFIIRNEKSLKLLP